jgi:hypothetical protein
MQRTEPSEAVKTAMVFAAIALAAMLQRQFVLGNADVAWLLTVIEKVRDGARLYIDVLETNPPASVWLYMPFVWLAGLTSVRPEILIDIVFTSAAAASAWSVGSWIGPAFTGPLWALRSFAFAVLALLPASCFGEREHAVLILFLPLMALARLRADATNVSLAVALPAGLLVGIVGCLKPHFIIALAMTSIAAAVLARSIRPLLSVENIIGALLFAAYVAATFAFYPQFWNEMVPLTNHLYIPVRLPIHELLFGNLLPILAEVLVIAIYLLMKRGLLARSRPFLVAASASLGFLFIAIAQGKGWPYHFYPAFGLVILMLGTAAIGDLRDQWHTRLVTFATTAAFAVQFWHLFDIGLDMRSFQARMQAIDAHPRMASLASDFAIAFPTVRELHGQWIGRSFSRWISYHVAGLAQEPGFDRNKLGAFRALEEADRAGFVDDISKGRPTLILVERRPFDFLAWAMKDSRIADIMACYEPADRIVVGNFDTPRSHGLDIEFYRPRAGMTDPQRPLGCAADR